MNTRHSSIETLEARIAPARMLSTLASADISDDGGGGGGGPATLFDISPDGRTATLTDFDGDVVSVTVSKGRLKAGNFTLTTNPANGRVHIDLLDISAAKSGGKFQGANILVQVVQSSAGSDTFGDLAAINAKGIDLGKVIVGDGDLGQIDVGDADRTTPAIKLISASQMGFNGSAGQIAGQDTVSKIRGQVIKLNLGQLTDAFIDVKGGGISQITLTSIDASNESTDHNGSIRAEGTIGTVSVFGDSGNGIRGGVGRYSGVIWSRTKIGAVTVTGNLTGGGGFDSGAIFAASPDSDSFPIAKKIGPVVINGSIVGGVGINSGTLYADSGLKRVSIAGDVTGGVGDTSGTIASGRGLGNISIAGNLTSGSGPSSGSIVAFDGDAPSIVIGGQIVAENFADSGIFVNGFIGTLSFQSAPGGGGNATEIRALFGIGAINVFGNMNDVFVRAGANTEGASINSDASIGTVLIHGNFAGGGLEAGAAPGADGFTFTRDDVLASPDAFPQFLATIGSVMVGGTFTPLAVEAEQIGSITVASTPIFLEAGAHNDDFLLGATVVKEIS